MSVTPDGQTIASGSSDGTVKLWNLNIDALLGLSCNWLNDYLITRPQVLDKLERCQTPSLLVAATPALVSEALAIARRGKFEEAVVQLLQAQTWNPTVDLDPVTNTVEGNPEAVAAIRVALSRLETGQQLARRGDIDEAILAYQEAQAFDPSLEITSDNWQHLCWNGIRHNAPDKVLFACNTVVILESGNKWGWQYRGIARALVNDLAGAAQDLQTVIAWLNNPQAPFFPEDEWKPRRQEWLSALQAGQNPFTPEEIEQVPTITLRTGDIQITLDWSTPADLDLAVTDPNGNRINYEQPTIPSNGKLEADITCSNQLPTPIQVENIFWPQGMAQPGTYIIDVNLANRCETSEVTEAEAATETSIDFTVNVLVKGQLQPFNGTLSNDARLSLNSR